MPIIRAAATISVIVVIAFLLVSIPMTGAETYPGAAQEDSFILIGMAVVGPVAVFILFFGSVMALRNIPSGEVKRELKDMKDMKEHGVAEEIFLR